MELRVGNKYRLGRKIGSGSFGDIYLGNPPPPPPPDAVLSLSVPLYLSLSLSLSSLPFTLFSPLPLALALSFTADFVYFTRESVKLSRANSYVLFLSSLLLLLFVLFHLSLFFVWGFFFIL